METFGSRLQDYERDARPENKTPEGFFTPDAAANALEYEPELSREIVENMEKTAARVRDTTGIDIRGARVEGLDQGVAGQYNLNSGVITLNESIFAEDAANDSDFDKTEHVLMHEAFHARNHNLSGGERVLSVPLEEALTESATAQETRQTIAYPNEIATAQAAAASSDTSFGQLINYYRDGENDKINEWLMKLDAPNDSDLGKEHEFPIEDGLQKAA